MMIAYSSDLSAHTRDFKIHKNLDWIPVGSHISSYFDPTGDLSFSDIKKRIQDFKQSKTDAVNLPLGQGQAWIYIDIFNPTQHAQQIWLVNALFLTESVSFFLPDGQGHYQEYERNFADTNYNNQLPHRFPSVKWTVPPGKHRIFMRQKNIVVNRINLRISDLSSFMKRERFFLVVQVFLLGITFCLALLKLVQFIADGQLSNLIYSCSAASIATCIFITSNYWRYIPIIPNFQSSSILSILVLLMTTAKVSPIEFAINYLNLSQEKPKVVRCIRLIIYPVAITELALAYYDALIGVPLMIVTFMLSVFLCSFLSIWRLKYSQTARYLFMGWMVVLISMFISATSVFGLLPTTLFNYIAVSMAIPLENMILFFGLSKIDKNASINRQMKIKELNHQLQDRVTTLKNIAAGVAHEINNPLAIITGNLELIGNLNIKSDQKDKINIRLQKAQECVLRVSSITQELLTFSLDKKTGARSEVYLEGILSQTINSLREQLKENKITIEANSLAKNETMILASPLSLAEAFLKILKNAFEAVSNEPDPKIEIHLYKIGLGRVEVAISDNGPGITAEIRDSMFDPFTTTKRHQSAAGLGLSSAKSIIESHHGALTERVEDRHKLGITTFVVTLPLAHLEESNSLKQA